MSIKVAGGTLNVDIPERARRKEESASEETSKGKGWAPYVRRCGREIKEDGTRICGSENIELTPNGIIVCKDCGAKTGTGASFS